MDDHDEYDANEEIHTSGPNRFTWKKLASLVVGAAVALVAIRSAAGFTRESPPEKTLPTGLSIDGRDTMSLASDAPQWAFFKSSIQPAKVSAARLSDPFPARVKVDETLTAKVSAPLAGRVTAVYVELGQHVLKGKPIASISSSDATGMRADRTKAKLAVQHAKVSLDRVRALVEAQALPEKELQQAEQDYKQALIDEESTQTKLSVLSVDGAETAGQFTVVAPRDGWVIEKGVVPSQAVGLGDPIVAIADVSDVWVVADIFEADAFGIQPGSKAQITSPSLPDLRLDATVDTVSAVVDPNRHTIGVKVRVANIDRRLRPNMFAEMWFELPPRPGALEVPASSLVTDGEKQYVIVQESASVLRRHRIIATSAHQGVITILPTPPEAMAAAPKDHWGVKPGDLVVTDGAILLDNELAIDQ